MDFHTDNALNAVKKGVTDKMANQMIIEMVKEGVVRRVRETLEEVVDHDIEELDGKEGVSEEEKGRIVRRIRHVEFELTEKIEKVKKKIGL